ncbi:NAD(P)-dependent oxidoreductase [Pseudochelatococcus contaminans]|uniref:Glycerate dehydrogenase n=1 Tax=Pseudochelatococcus contaminans TaxID=1538103 RepID=A0A7W5Z646_9HYPH|nr:NAD(P)-dependent oxidoreductase [Pseudochelatococcus contaminans]MBB3810540.1 glycerate dehydrogenase [Pseudochelatococcus contaminans]
MSEHIVFLDSEGIGPTVKLHEPSFPHTWKSYAYTQPEDVVERLRDATIVMTCSVPLREEHLRQLPKLRMISLALTGTDIVDVDYCHAHDIVVTNVPGYAENTVAEHTLSFILDLMRRTSGYHDLLRKVHRGEIEPKNIYFDYRVRDIRGKVLGIIGSGPIARRLAELARCFGMTVYYQDFFGRLKGDEFLPFDRLLDISDVISINCPLTDETRNLFDDDAFLRMKQDAIIVNTGRGGIINEQALIRALKDNRIAGAAIDVIENEPVRPDDPLFELIDRPDFILNPHVAWSSEDAMQGLIDRAVGNIVQFVEGKEPEGAVRRENT